MSSKRAAAKLGRELTISLLEAVKISGNTQNFSGKEFSQKQIVRREYEVKRLGFIRKNNDAYVLTVKGQRQLNEEAIWKLAVKTPKSWDERWHLVLFDIPTRRKKYRDVLRLRMRELGLELYQDSVWVHPFPIEEIISEIARFYMIEKYISFAEVTKLTGTNALREKFSVLTNKK